MPDQSVNIGAKAVGAKIGATGSGARMGMAMDKIAGGEAIPGNLAAEISPFVTELQAILSDPTLRQQFMNLVKKAHGGKMPAKQESVSESEILRLQRLAGIQIQEDGEVQKIAVGHVDDERDMLRKEIYQMGAYCVELFKMVSSLPDADFPHWWQSKIVKAGEFISTAKHYLENELEVPDEPAMVSPDVEQDDDPSGVS